MASDGLLDFSRGRINMINKSSQTNGDDGITLPSHSKLLVFDGIAERNSLNELFARDIPDLESLVSRNRSQLLSIGTPSESKDSTTMGIGSIDEFSDLLAFSSFVENNLSISSTTSEERAILVVTNGVDESCMVMEKLNRWIRKCKI